MKECVHKQAEQCDIRFWLACRRRVADCQLCTLPKGALGKGPYAQLAAQCSTGDTAECFVKFGVRLEVQ